MPHQSIAADNMIVSHATPHQPTGGCGATYTAPRDIQVLQLTCVLHQRSDLVRTTHMATQRRHNRGAQRASRSTHALIGHRGAAFQNHSVQARAELRQCHQRFVRHLRASPKVDKLQQLCHEAMSGASTVRCTRPTALRRTALSSHLFQGFRLQLRTLPQLQSLEVTTPFDNAHQCRACEVLAPAQVKFLRHWS